MVVSFLLRYTKGLSWDFVPRAIHKGDNQRLFTWTWTSEKGGEVLDWKKDVERLHFDEGKSITEITGLLAKKSLLPDGVTVARRYGDIYGDIQGEKYRLRQIIKKVRWSINQTAPSYPRSLLS